MSYILERSMYCLYLNRERKIFLQKTTIKNYIIRNYQEKDADKIASFDFMAMLAYRYNKDYKPENIFCAVDSEENICGVAHLELDSTWHFIDDDSKPSNFVYSLNIDMSMNPSYEHPEELGNELFQLIRDRARTLRNEYPHKKVKLSYTTASDELEELDYFLSKGFTTRRSHLVMKRDLTEELPEVTVPDKIKIVNWKMETLEEQQKYLQAEADGDPDSAPWSINRLQWTKNGSEWNTFTAFEDDKVVGSVMTWGLGETRSATENIFVLPEWRRKGIAKAVIVECLNYLKENGKTEATLGVFGENGRAIALYRSLGYKMLGVNLELGLDI